MNKNIILALFALLFIAGCAPQQEKEVCGGWDTFGEIVCKCDGEFVEHNCEPNAVCDSGSDFCYGKCGECKCYKGPEKDNFEISCEGRPHLPLNNQGS